MTLEELKNLKFSPRMENMYEILENEPGDFYLHFKDSYIGEIDLPDGPTDYKRLFEDCNIQKGCYICDDIDTSKVTNMESMFAYATIPEGFTLGQNFDTSSVENMENMFENATIAEGFELSPKFDTSKVMNMKGMFKNAELPKDFVIDERFNASKEVSPRQKEMDHIFKSFSKIHLSFDNEEFIKNRQTNKITLDETSKIDELNNAFEFLNSDIDITRNNIFEKANEYFNKSNKKIFERDTCVNKISKEMATMNLTNDIISNKDNELLNIEKNIVLNDAQTLKELIDLKYNSDIFEIKKCEQIIPNEMSPKNVIKATYYHLHFKDTYEGEIKIPAGLSNLDNLFEDCNIKPGCYLSEECDLSKVTSMQDMFKNTTGLDDKLFNIDEYTVFKDTNQLIIYNNEGTKCSFDDIILSNPDLLKAINDKLNELENNKKIENHNIIKHDIREDI